MSFARRSFGASGRAHRAPLRLCAALVALALGGASVAAPIHGIGEGHLGRVDLAGSGGGEALAAAPPSSGEAGRSDACSLCLGAAQARTGIAVATALRILPAEAFLAPLAAGESAAPTAPHRDGSGPRAPPTCV
jgi:hypothetical protein